MPTTTIAAIRDRMVTVMRALTPSVFSSDRFIPFENEERADFETWANSNPDGATRMFQIRDLADGGMPDYSRVNVEERFVRFRISVAYPASNRWGNDEALDRDDVIESDRYQIERALGLYGRANFTAPYPDACWRPDGEKHTVLRATGCDFLIIEQTMSYYRATDGLVLSNPNDTIQLQNASGQDVVMCTPVYSTGAGTFGLAIATSLAAATVQGLAFTGIASGDRGRVQVSDIFTATAAQWDAVCGTSGGLTYGTTYYLSATTAGQLTATAPTTGGQFVTPVIVGVAATQARLAIESPIGL